MFFRRRKPLSPRRSRALRRTRSAAEILETRALLAVFTVTTDEDSLPGDPSIAGSLRWAIEQANADAAFDRIEFDIAPSPGQTDVTIQPNYALPAITQTVLINGQSQPGWLDRPIVELRGQADENGAPAGVDGLVVSGNDVEVRGLAITRFTGSGILVQGRSAIISGNYFGTARDGVDDLGNIGNGIHVLNSKGWFTDNVVQIGGTTPESLNVIAGNDRDGISIENSSRILVNANLIGTTADGLSSLGNEGNGISVRGANSFGNYIGSFSPGRNIVSGNNGNGIFVAQNVPRVFIQENIVGLGLDGQQALPNHLSGMVLHGYDAYVSDNTVSGNTLSGISIDGQTPADGVVGWITGDDNRDLLIGGFYQNNGSTSGGSGSRLDSTAAKVGLGLLFDGIDDLAVPASASTYLFDADVEGSLELWARFDALTGDRVIAENYAKQGTEPSQGWSLFRNDNQQIVLALPGDRFLTSAPLPQLLDGSFHHIALTRSTSTVNVYLDGSAIASASVPSSESWTPTGFSTFRIGFRDNTQEDGGQGIDGASMFFGGVLDELTTYRRTLSSAEITAIITAGAEGKAKPASHNEVLSNFIGTDQTGTRAVGNGGDGVWLKGTSWLSTITDNTVSGNTGIGVHISTIRGVSVTISYNRIGTSHSGLFAIGNETGVLVDGSGDVTILGGGLGLSTISGNRNDGIQITAAATGTVNVSNVKIGTDISGQRSLGNGRYGISVERDDNITYPQNGNDVTIAGSVISGNVLGGISIDDRRHQVNFFDTGDVRISGNLIGTDASGNHGLGNGPFGIHLTGTSEYVAYPINVVVVNDNTVSGQDIGVYVSRTQPYISNNRIGTNQSGSTAIANRIGLLLENVGTTNLESNLISGNTDVGLSIFDNYGTLPAIVNSGDIYSSALAIGGRIGTDALGQNAIPNGVGVRVSATNADNWFPHVDIYGQIGGNLGYGIEISAAASHLRVRVRGARIGIAADTSDPLPNGAGGILINGDAADVGVSLSTIAWNRGPGIRQVNSATRHFVLGDDGPNSFFGNQGLAVDLGESGPTPNDDPETGDNIPNYPVLTSASIIGNEVLIEGTNDPIAVFTDNSHFLSNAYSIQFFTTRPTTSGRGQGERPLGLQALLNGAGDLPNFGDNYRDYDERDEHFRFRIPMPDELGSGVLLTAAIVHDPFLYNNYGIGTDSEFSNIIPIGSVLSSLAPVVDAGGSVQLFAGDSLTRTVSFRDEDSNAFEVLVDYGDGTGKQPLDYRRENRTMLLDHVYQKAGAYTVTVSVLDDSTPMGRIGTDSFQVVVQNTPPEIAFNEVQLTKRIREGETVNLIGTFADLGAEDAHTIEVDWGDGTAVTPEPIASGARSFALNHRYDDDGVSRADAHVYRVVVTVRDEFGAASATPVFLVEVDNVVPSALQLTLDQTTIDEGGIVTLSGSFADPGLLDTHLVYVNWGDGSPKEKVPQDQILQTGFLREFSLGHTYLDNPVDGSSYTITVEVGDDDDPLNVVSSTLQLAVNNLLPYFNETGTGQPPVFLSDDVINEGDSVAAFAYFLDQGTEQHTARVNWGDGTPESLLELPASGSLSFLPFLNHRYEQDGVFEISVSVSDRDTPPGSEAVTSKLITVRNVAPTVLPISFSPAGSIFEGDEVSVSGFFTDPAADEPYVVTVNWGDGTTSAAEVDRTARSYSATHRYLDDPTAANDQYSITVSVNDGVQTGTRSVSKVVQNVAPVLNVLPIVDTSTSNPVFRAVAEDPSPLDQASLSYSWTLTKNGVNVPFVSRSATEIELDPAMIPAGTAPLILTTTVDDGDGGVTPVSSVLIVGTSSAETLTVTDSSFPTGQTLITVLGLGGNDILNASGITATGLHVTLYGGEGDDLLFDGAGSDTLILGWGNDSLNLPTTDPQNTPGIVGNMGGDDVVFLIPNSVLTAYDSVGNNTLNFSLADSGITQATGVTFDLELTQRSTIVAQDVAPGSLEPATHFVAALGMFDTLVGSNYGDSLTGASDSAVLGGLGNDNFYTKDDISDATFSGGADADVLTARGVRVARISFKGDDGIDELRIDEFAEVLDNLDFDGGNDADLLVNRGKVARIVFKGGADADVLQNKKGRISKISFKGDDGIDQFINEEFASIEWQAGDDPTLRDEQGIDFDGGSDADILINRGKVSRIVFKGGADADVLQNQRGRISKISFRGDDGIDQFINEEFATIAWQAGDDPEMQAEQGIDFDGGSDADVLINRGRVSRVVFKGGADADLLQNQRGRITKISFKGDDGADEFINEEDASVEWLDGDDPDLQFEQGIDFDGGNDADILINRGRVSRVVFRGGADADVLQNQRGRVSKISFKGDDGADTFLNEEFAAIEWLDGDDPDLQTEQGIDFEGGNDADILINRGRVSRVVFKGGADADVLQNRKGRITRIVFTGDDGDDLLINDAEAVVARDDATETGVEDGIFFIGGPDSLEVDPFGDPGSDADILINRGRVSRVVFRGGADEDLLDLQSGEVTEDVVFEGGDDADVLVSRSRVGKIRFNGDAGADEFLITGEVDGTVADGGLVEFNGGDDADLLVSRGTIRRLVFRGGADDNAEDVLQTSGGSIEELEFINDSGAGILVNRSSNISSLTFTGGSDADMFINRGQNIGSITFIGGGGDDVFVNSGSTNPNQPGVLTFDAGDGSNAMRNEGTGLAEVIYTGGLGEDFLQNNATGIALLNYNGGTGSNALENNASGISNIVVDGSDDNDIFANDGDNVSGIVFNARNGSNTLINTGSNVSGIEYNGGGDDDRFMNSGFALKDSTFHAEAGDDRLFNFGARTENVTMIGGSGADWWINQTSAVGCSYLTLQAGAEDDAADAFINWAANVSNVIVDGGDGDDLLQNGGLNSSGFQFTGGSGNDLLLNLGYGTDQFTFDAGEGDDVFENRGRSGGTLRMLGGTGDDGFYQNAGFATDIELDGGGGDDTVLNFSSEMGRVALIGGDGHDILQNSGNDIGSLELTGGAGKNTLQNFGHRIGTVRMSGSGTFAGAFDTLLNSGNAIGLIDVTSNVTTTVISSGNDITSLSVMGSALNDVVRITGRDVQLVTLQGNGGDDSLLVDLQSGVGSAITYFGGSGDDLLILRGAIDALLFDGGTDDDQSVLAGSVNSGILRGDTGDDLYRFVGSPFGNVTIDEVFTGTSTVTDLSSDTLDFSSFTAGPITLDLAITTPQVQPTIANPLIITLTSDMGLENVVGTSGADTILGNARDNAISGAQFPSPGLLAPGTPVARTKTQWVYLDFFSSHDPGEHVYSEAEALEVKHRIELAYTGFNVRFVLNASDLPASIASDPSQYVTIHFNQTPSSGRPGGEASEIDFGNIDDGGTATVQVNGLLGGREVLDPGLQAVAAAALDGDVIQAPDIPKPASTVENFIALSAKIATHELAHLLGVRHYDAFGPIGFGINAPPGTDRFKPTFAGIAGAFETADHLISSPASAGTDRFNDLRDLYFGEREAIKLALAFSDQDQVRKTEQTTPHNAQAMASPLELVTLDVPNLATQGVSKDKSFSVQATSVVGTIGLAGTTSESDWYSFTGTAGDIVTIEVMSGALQRYTESNATSIDSVLRLYNAAGELVQTFGKDAVNDDEFESSDSLLMDITLPAAGQYFIEVDTFQRLPGDANYDAAVALRTALEARRDDADPDNNLSPEEQQLLERLADSLDDTDTGSYELLMYRSTSANTIDDIDDIQGREGIDQISGGPGDDYSMGLQVAGSSTSNQSIAWSGSYVFTDRGGYSWTVLIDYGDGSSSIVTNPNGTSRGIEVPLSHVYTSSGLHTITVTLTSDDGLTQTESTTILVSSSAPTATLSGPTSGFTGLSLTYDVAVTNPGGGSLSYAWAITRNGVAYAAQTGGVSYSLNTAAPGSYTIAVTITDGNGGTVTTSIDVAVAASVAAIDVASGMTQRSWINALDVVFGSEQMAADLMANPSRVRLTKFGLNGPNADGSGGTSVNFGGASGLVKTGANLKLNFGDKVIGAAGRNSTTADGYYRLEFDFDGDGITDAVKHFYRLLGDVNGDMKVDAADANLILAGMSKPYSRELDINGDGVVNNTDRGWTQRSNGRKLKDGLFSND